MDVNDLRSAVTVLSLLLFSGLMAWTWWPRRQAAHQAASLLPFVGEANEQDEGASQ